MIAAHGLEARAVARADGISAELDADVAARHEALGLRFVEARERTDRRDVRRLRAMLLEMLAPGVLCRRTFVEILNYSAGAARFRERFYDPEPDRRRGRRGEPCSDE